MGSIKRWKTLESIAVEDYFKGIAQSNRWASTGKLDKPNADCKQDLPRKDKFQLDDPSLTCGVCRQQYNRPKLLHCLHSFCKSCVESLVKDSDTESQFYTVVCPICRTKSEVLKNSFEELPTNFLITSKLQAVVLREAHQTKAVTEEESTIEPLTEEESATEPLTAGRNEDTATTCANCDEKSPATGKCEECAEVLCDGCSEAHRRVRVTRNHRITPLVLLTQTDEQNNMCSPNSCPKHSHEELAYFCLTCDTVVCRECTETQHSQPVHSFKPLREVTWQQRRSMALLLEQVKQKIPFLKRTLLEIDDASHSVPEHVAAIADQIKSSSARYIRALKEREEQLLDDLDAMREYKATVLAQQKEKVSQKIKAVANGCEFTEKVLKEGENVDIAHLKKFITERLSQLDSLDIDIEPEEGPQFDYVTEEDLLLEMVIRTGKIESSMEPCAARAMGEGLYKATIGKTSSFTVATGPSHQSKEDLNIRIETPDGIILADHITDLGNGLLDVSYTPKVYGVHEISILSRDQHVPESPFNVIAKKGHMSFTRSTKRTIPACLRVGYKGEGRGELDAPADVAVCSNGRVLVADTNNHRIQIFDGRGTFIREFGSHGQDLGQFHSPGGISIVHDGQIVVTDQVNNRLQVFSPKGIFLKSMSCCGTGDELKGPRGIATDEDGQVLVVDQQNHRVVVYSADGQFVQAFGSLGTGNGQFNNPMYIALNQDGDIYVTDSCNHRVQVFDLTGKFVKKFGRPGTAEGEFQYPSGIAVDSSGYVFVSDRSNRVQVFNQHLRYVAKFGGKQSGEGQLSDPLGLDYTPEGRVAVADSANNCIKVFYFPSDQF